LTIILGAALFAGGLFFFFREKEKAQVLRHAYFLIGLQMILMPVALHPWYVLPLIPLLAFFPNPAWLLFSGLVAFSYLKYASPGGLMPPWVLLLEYLPLFSLLVIESLRRQHAGQAWPWPSRKEDLPGVQS
jgi:hypothetical protein